MTGSPTCARSSPPKKIAIDDTSVDRLLDATGGHPQDTMQVCAALYYLMRDAAQRVVTADLLGIAYEQALRELERPFALHWSELGKQKYLQLVATRVAQKPCCSHPTRRRRCRGPRSCARSNHCKSRGLDGATRTGTL